MRSNHVDNQSDPLSGSAKSTRNQHAETATGQFNRLAAFRSIAASLTFNALCPYLLFRYLEPRFPDESVLPLLYSTVFPVIGFLFGVLRNRTIDAVALIALAGILIHVAMTILARDLSMALVLRSLEGAIVGSCFLLSVAIGRPIILYIARQFAAAGNPQGRLRFELVVAMDQRRAFSVATTVWGAVLVVMSGVHVLLAIYLPHPTFVLVSPILAIVTNLILLGWSMRYISRRLSEYLRGRG